MTKTNKHFRLNTKTKPKIAARMNSDTKADLYRLWYVHFVDLHLRDRSPAGRVLVVLLVAVEEVRGIDAHADQSLQKKTSAQINTTMNANNLRYTGTRKVPR